MTIRYCMASVGLCLWTANAFAANVAVAGVFPGKALLVIDGGAPRALAVGQKSEDGVRVVAIDGDAVTLEVDGQKRVLRIGQHAASQKTGSERQETTLAADSKGHFFGSGSVNGRSIRFIVDTGASMVSMGAADADRIGVDWRKGQAGIASTANGQVRVWKVRLDSVRVGDITVHGVDGLVHETDLPIVLLGMSFLSRMEIRNEGSTMTLKKRY
jgi:aspartyl protease family protein